MTSDTKRVILAYSAPQNVVLRGNKKITGRIRCAGCGKWISSDDDLSDVGYSVTKRKTASVFHNKCFSKVWNMLILGGRYEQ